MLFIGQMEMKGHHPSRGRRLSLRARSIRCISRPTASPALANNFNERPVRVSRPRSSSWARSTFTGEISGFFRQPGRFRQVLVGHRLRPDRPDIRKRQGEEYRRLPDGARYRLPATCTSMSLFPDENNPYRGRLKLRRHYRTPVDLPAGRFSGNISKAT